jgi:hypothetical protein
VLDRALAKFTGEAGYQFDRPASERTICTGRPGFADTETEGARSSACRANVTILRPASL